MSGQLPLRDKCLYLKIGIEESLEKKHLAEMRLEKQMEELKTLQRHLEREEALDEKCKERMFLWRL